MQNQTNRYIALATAITRLSQQMEAAKPVEEATLGAIILRPALVAGLPASSFGPELFPNYYEIAALVLAHIASKGTAGVAVIASACKSAGVAEVSDIHAIAAAADLDFFDAQVERLQRFREAQLEAEVRANTLVGIASGLPIDEVLAAEEMQRKQLSSEHDAKEERDQRYNKYLENIADRKNGKTSSAPMWPWYQVNKRMGRLEPGRVIVIGARPGMGKTTFTMQAAQYAATQAATLFLSLEMTESELLGKMIQARIGVERSRIESGEISDSVYKSVVDEVCKLYDLPLFFEDTISTLGALSQTVRRYVRQQGVKVVFIDYLQLINDTSRRYSNSNELIGTISRAIKAIAKAERVCVVLISQLSRAVETRGGAKRPILADLRDSGSIEQDADIIGFLYRAAYYSIGEDEQGEGVTELLVAKNRHYGAGIGTVFLHHNSETDTLHEEKPEAKPEADQPTIPAYNPVISPVIRTPGDEDIPF